MLVIEPDVLPTRASFFFTSNPTFWVKKLWKKPQRLKVFRAIGLVFGKREMENAQRAEMLKELAVFFDDTDKITSEYLKTVSIVVPAHGKGLGVDTTAMFKILPAEAQYGHGIVNPHPAAQTRPFGGRHADGNRASSISPPSASR